MLDAKQIEGTWELDAFYIKTPEGETKPWGINTIGTLIYTSTGHMSVSINSEKIRSAADKDEIFENMLFYAGTYRIEDNKIIHSVTIASDPKRIGKEMIREAELSDDHMALIGRGVFGTAVLKWRKIKKDCKPDLSDDVVKAKMKFI